MDSCSGGTRPVRNRKLLTAQRLNHEHTNKVMCPTVLDCGQFFRVRERITCFGQGRRVRPTKKPALYAGNPRSVPMRGHAQHSAATMSSAFVAAFCKRHPFSATWVRQDGPANVKQQNQAVTDRHYRTAG